MRSKKELYEIILNKFRTTSTPFICNQIENLFELSNLITKEECEMILNDFHSNYPSTTQHSEFMNDLFNQNNEYGSWWRNVDSRRAKNIRITFLEKMVQINS